jgi:hypothetical protein
VTRLNSLQATRTRAIYARRSAASTGTQAFQQICPLANSRLSHLANGHHGRSGCRSLVALSALLGGSQGWRPCR